MFQQINSHGKNPGRKRNEQEIKELAGVHYETHRLSSPELKYLPKAQMRRYYILAKLKLEAKLYQREAIRKLELFEGMKKTDDKELTSEERAQQQKDIDIEKRALSIPELQALAASKLGIKKIYYLRDLS